jgi:hypothetical protein
MVIERLGKQVTRRDQDALSKIAQRSNNKLGSNINTSILSTDETAILTTHEQSHTQVNNYTVEALIHS